MNQRDINRFWSKVQQLPSGCWVRETRSKRAVYGQFEVDGKMHRTHRIAYLLANGEIPEGMQVCHSCDNPPCCNPAHLWIGTSLDNTLDSIRKGRKRGASGDASGMRTRPDRHPTRLHPEMIGSNAKLTWDQVKEIRRAYQTTPEPYPAIAERYGVRRSAIREIVQYKTWKPKTRDQYV